MCPGLNSKFLYDFEIDSQYSDFMIDMVLTNECKPEI